MFHFLVIKYNTFKMQFLSVEIFCVVMIAIIFSNNGQLLEPPYSNICIPYWTYNGNRGQDHWCCTGHYLCCGQNQSPINIDVRHASYLKGASCLQLLNYHYLPNSTMLYNNGHWPQLGYNAHNLTTIPHVTGVSWAKDARFNLDRVIFHWGLNSSHGSEHTLDYHRSPMEMQLIHRNIKYATMEVARNQTDGFLIISIFFMLMSNDNPNLRDLVYNLHQITFLGQRKCIKPFPISQLLPTPYGFYYIYNGSLPFPPCSNSVIWIIFHNPLYISEYQLNEFRKLQIETEDYCPGRSCPMVDNFRRTACVRNRTVFWREECQENSQAGGKN